MKKILSLLSAIALVGIVSCAKVPQNPDYNAETDEVLTQFVLNVSTGETPETKMTAENVQKDGGFLGMQDAKMFAYDQETYSPVYVTNNATLKKVYDLGKLYDNGVVTATHTNRILQLSVPTGVNSVLIYAKAINSKPVQDQGQIYENSNFLKHCAQRGYTTISIPTTTSPVENTYFDATRRLASDSDIDDYDATAALMIYVVNTILDANINAMAASDAAFEGYKNLPALSWEKIGHKYMYDNFNALDPAPVPAADKETLKNAYTGEFLIQDPAFPDDPTKKIERALLPLEEVIGNAYYLFTTIPSGSGHSGEYRAGSSKAVKSMMESMNSMITKSLGSTPTSAEEANAMRLANQIKNVMNNYFESDWTYKDVQTLKGAFTDEAWADNGFTGAKNLNKYPYEDFGIPEGAAQLAFSHSTDEFSYVRPNKPLVNPNATSFDPNKYVFPAELMYYVNSGIRTTDTETPEFPDGAAGWISGFGANWTVNTSVTSTTRGIAVRDNINYGVALLKTTVGYKESSSPLYDTMSENHVAFTNPSASGITLKGILVGGINPRYDWQYLPIERAGDKYGTFDGVIYDDQIVSGAIPTPENKETYTLVYDNYNREADAANQNDVYITLEFVNGSTPFRGRDNIIPAGGTFYLVAQLIPAGKTNANHTTQGAATVVWDDNYQVPPTYGVTKNKAGNIIAAADNSVEAQKIGKSMRIPRVFMQNYMTTAKFYIGPHSLEKAYYSVPDLKSAQLSVGLSVDISWKDGYTYELTF